MMRITGSNRRVFMLRTMLVVGVSSLACGHALAQEQPAPAPAQTSATNGQTSAADGQGPIGDIVVTAQKRAERTQDVPIAITAVTGDELTTRGITDVKSLAKAVPGLNVAVTGGYGGKTNYTLRGVGLNTYSSFQEPAVAVYVDEIYTASANAVLFSLFDIDHVEVLRGPQGTLFGRSASGGLVNYITKEPSRKADGYLTLGLGSYGDRLVEAAQNVPLDAAGDNALRLAFRYNGSDGFIHNEAGGKNLEGGELYVGRAELRLEPTQGLRILLKGEHGEFDSDHAVGYREYPSYRDSSNLVQLLGPAQNKYGTPGGDLFGFRDTSSDYWSTNSASPSFQYTQHTVLSGRADWDLGGVTLTSVSGYLRTTSRSLEDTDATPVNFITYAGNNTATEFEQELRLSSSPGAKVRWTVGGFYFNYKVDTYVNARLPIGVPPLGITTPLSIENFGDQKRHSFAGYGQIEVPLADKLSITAGGRIERDVADFTYSQAYTPTALGTAILGAPPVVFSPALDGDLARIRKTYYSGGATLNYKPSNRILLYASLKRGIKPGGFSSPLSGIPVENFKFNEEKLDALEGGIKSDWLDGKLRVNVSAFHYWYNGYQAVQYRATKTYTGNTDARVNGFDSEIIFAPSRAVELGLSGGYVDAIAENIPLRDSSKVVNYRDRRMPNAPAVSLNAYAQYKMDLAGGDLALRLDEVFRSKTYFEIQDSPGLSQNAYHTEDLSANWKKDGWSFSASVSNVLNRKYLAYVQDDTDFGFVIATPARPRWFMVRASKSW